MERRLPDLTSGLSNLSRPPRMDGSVVFARLRQYAHHLVHPIRHPQSAPYRFCPLLSRFEYIDCQTCTGMSWAGHLSPENCPFTSDIPRYSSVNSTPHLRSTAMHRKTASKVTQGHRKWCECEFRPHLYGELAAVARRRPSSSRDDGMPGDTVSRV